MRKAPIPECCQNGALSPLADPVRQRAAAAFRALGDETRLAIIQALLERGEICACNFLDCCSITQPTLSYHLKALRDAGLVQSRKKGLWVYYSIVASAIAELNGLLANNLTATSKDCGCNTTCEKGEEENESGH
jgi:ArsR family transcriptional regulator